MLASVMRSASGAVSRAELTAGPFPMAKSARAVFESDVVIEETREDGLI